jgi:hypothetical protein
MLIALRLLVDDVAFARRLGSTWRETWRFVLLQWLTRSGEQRERDRERNGYDPHT